MFGRFWSYAPVRCANGELGHSGNGSLPGVQTYDVHGNIWLHGRPRTGESVPEWIKRQVVAALDAAPVVWVPPVKDGQGFYVHHGHYMRPWFSDPNVRVVTVRPDYAERGCYAVEVYRYSVDMVKAPKRVPPMVTPEEIALRNTYSD